MVQPCEPSGVALFPLSATPRQVEPQAFQKMAGTIIRQDAE